MARRAFSLLLTCALLVGLTAPSSASAESAGRASLTIPATTLLPAPPGDEFFHPPYPLPGRPGDVIWARPSPTPIQDVYGAAADMRVMPNARRSDGSNVSSSVWHVLYRTTDRKGRALAVAAMLVFDPSTAAQAPVLVSGHGWVGFGSHCGLFGSTWRGGLASLSTLRDHTASKDYVLVAPDMTGITLSRPTTSMIAKDSARILIDAARAAAQFTGASNSSLFYGHSLSGTAVLGVGGEAAAYAPELEVRGVVSVAGGGLTGPGSPYSNSMQRRVEDSSVSHAARLAYLLMLEQSYGKRLFNKDNHLTPLGRRLSKRIPNLCSTDIQGLVSMRSWDELFTGSTSRVEALDPGTLALSSTTPTYILSGRQDAVVPALPVYHAYRHLCASGAAAWWENHDGDHILVGRMAMTDPESPLLDWIDDALGGRPLSSPCQPHEPTTTVGTKLTARYLAEVFGIRIPAGHSTLLRSSGSCKVLRGLIRPVRPGECRIQLHVRPPKGVSKVRSLVLQVEPSK